MFGDPGFGVYLSPNNEFSVVSKIDRQGSPLKYNVYFSMRLCFSFPPWAGLIETQGNQVARLESCSVCTEQCPSGWQSVFHSAPHHPSLPQLVFLTVSGSKGQHASHTSSTKNGIST